MSGPLATSPCNLQQALEHLEADGPVAFPSETVWGLAVRAESRRAVEGLRSFKGRAGDRPISVLVDGPASLERFGVSGTPLLWALAREFWPGALTLVLAQPAGHRLTPGVAGPTGAIGFRCSDHPLTALLVREALERGLGPLTATSFNRSGQTPVQTHREAISLAKSQSSQRVIVLDPGAHDAYARPPSTVLDLSGAEPRVLRWGAIDEQRLAPLLAGLRGVGPGQ